MGNTYTHLVWRGCQSLHRGKHIHTFSCVLITVLVNSLYLFRLFVFWSRVTITWIMGLGVNKVEKDNFFEKEKQFFRFFPGL